MKDAKSILKRSELWEKLGKWAGFAVCLFIGTVMTFGMHMTQGPFSVSLFLGCFSVPGQVEALPGGVFRWKIG